MTEMKVTPEEPIVRLTISADAGFLPPVMEFVKQMTAKSQPVLYAPPEAVLQTANAAIDLFTKYKDVIVGK